MMLTAGIELAEGKSSLAELGVPGVGGTDDRPGIRGPAPLVASGAGPDAVAVAPEAFAGQASAWAPIETSNRRDFILATTRAGSRNSRSSAQSAPLQPRVIRT
jgi:hypothetical protein